MDKIGEITDADVVCLLVGERPGLVTAESMSAYIAQTNCRYARSTADSYFKYSQRWDTGC